ncbi:MAG: CARDB domain-containing protein [Leptolyngbyaceae cyanobacterium]
MQASYRTGDTLEVQFQVGNDGRSASGPFDVNFYLSINNYISRFDYRLGRFTIANMAGNTDSGLLTAFLTLPPPEDTFWEDLSDGRYSIGMSIDQADDVAETNEANNHNLGQFADYDNLQISQIRPVNLTGQHFNVVQEPLSAGDRFDLQFRVQNTGTNTAGEFDVHFYLSGDDDISPADYSLGSYTLTGIAGNRSSDLTSITWVLPEKGNAVWEGLGDGTYHFGMYVDQANVVAETDESDNRNVSEFVDSDSLIINDTAAIDLSGKFFNVVQEPLKVGDSFDVEFRIQNTEASTSGAFDVHFYLSANDYINPRDRFLGGYTINNIDGNSNSELLTTSLALPESGDAFWPMSDDGAYTIGMIIDPERTIAETTETNNSNLGEFKDYDAVWISNDTFAQFGVVDASGDSTLGTVFDDGALRLSYDWSGSASSLFEIRLEALQNGNVMATLGSWREASLTDELVDLADIPGFIAGAYDLRLVANNTDGEAFVSASESISILPWLSSSGDFTADTLNYDSDLGSGAVFLGRGGTDTLDLSGIATTDVAHINGVSLGSFAGSTANQAIFGGTAFDYLTLMDGREVYFQGIETIAFADTAVALSVQADDPYFDEQWNLHISDVTSAWRFTQGSRDVLLASLDSGVLTAPGASGGIHDIALSRLITDPTDDDNFEGFYSYGHGHQAISVMSSTVNNSTGVTGINWHSDIYVADVYSGVSLQQAITDAIAHARANNQKVVFQGGVQGEFWLTSGGSQAELEQLIQDNDDVALFAIAAGNGGPSGNLNDPNYLTSVSGVGKLETAYDNVLSVGALQHSGTGTADGLTNATGVNLANYSNRGSNLTMVAATDSPAMDKLNSFSYFGGTSAANPNLAGIASLVWSVNDNLDGGDVRQIMIDTGMDLGSTGRDNTYGHGLVNADAAVRRAWALGADAGLAGLYDSGPFLV